MVSEMLVQCFEVLNTYGKQPEQLETITKMFHLSLEGYSPSDIRKAFVDHIQKSSVMPTPADIVSLIEKGYRERSIDRKLDEYRSAYKAIEAPKNAVPWAYRKWDDLTPAERNKLRQHIAGMDVEKGVEYIKYLTGHCEYPKGEFTDGRA